MRRVRLCRQQNLICPLVSFSQNGRRPTALIKLVPKKCQNHLLAEMLPPCLVAVVLSFLLATRSSCVTITHTSQLTTLTYDYIVIGGVSSVSEHRACMKVSISRDRWTRRREPAHRRSRNYCAGSGGGREVSRLSMATLILLALLTISFLSDEGVIPAIAPFLAPTLIPSEPGSSTSPLRLSLRWHR